MIRMCLASTCASGGGRGKEEEGAGLSCVRRASKHARASSELRFRSPKGPEKRSTNENGRRVDRTPKPDTPPPVPHPTPSSPPPIPTQSTLRCTL